MVQTLVDKRSDADAWEIYSEVLLRDRNWKALWGARLNTLRSLQDQIWNSTKQLTTEEFTTLLSRLAETIKHLLNQAADDQEASNLSGLVMTVKNCHKKIEHSLRTHGLTTKAEPTKCADDIAVMRDELAALTRTQKCIPEEDEELETLCA